MAAHLAIYVLGVTVYVLGFTAPWDRWLELDGRQKTWLTIAAWPARNGWVSFSTATVLVLLAAIVCAVAGAGLRLFGAARGGGGLAKALGTWLHTLALSILMPPSGAIFTVISIAGFELILQRTALAPSESRLTWGHALLAEIYVVGVALSFAVLGWRYNSLLLTKCVLVCFGVSLVARAFTKTTQTPA